MTGSSKIPPATRKFISLIAAVLIAVTILLAVMHNFVHSIIWQRDLAFIPRMWDLDTEANVPTWFASLLWFFVSVSALISFLLERTLAERRSPISFGWLVVSLVFLVASCDEVATIHEEVGTFLHTELFTWSHAIEPDAFPTPDMIAWLQAHQTAPDSPWLLFYLPFLAAFGLAAIAFLFFRLRQYKPLLMLATLTPICFATALTMDYFQGMPEEKEAQIATHLNMTREGAQRVSIVIEETLENLGCIALILSLGGYAHLLAVRFLEMYKQREMTSESKSAEENAPIS